MRILLVDDHELVRTGLRCLLKEIEGVEVVAEAQDGVRALELIDEAKPDLLVTDISMPRMGGLELASRAADRYPDLKVMFLSMHTEEEYVGRALTMGAAGFLPKDADAGEVAKALQTIMSGGTYLSPSISAQVLEAYRRQTGRESDPTSNLTPRQVEVLRLIAEGNTTKSIARQLGISLKTAETHRAQLMERLDLHDVAGLVRYAIRIGLVQV